MKKRTILSGALLQTALLMTLPGSAVAQQDNSMPGMSMPSQGQARPGTSPKAAPQAHAPGAGQRAGSPAQQPQQGSTPPSSPGSQSGAAPTSAPGSMPDMPGMDMKNGEQTAAPAPAQSITHNTLGLQEPENPSFHIGTETPAPLLLGDVSRRTPLALDSFLLAAEHGNPTLAEADALVRRSTAQARQAGLYPNPSAGYQGEQIRGGSYGDGEQGGFVEQPIVLGGKLGARRDIYAQQAASDRIGVEEQRFRIRDDVTEAFYTALFSQAIVVERQNLLHVAEDALTTAHQLANVGQADAPDVLQAEVEAEQAKIDFVTAQREFLEAFRVLAVYSGQPELPVSPLAGDLEQPPAFNAEQQVAAIVSGSPTIRRTEQELAVAEARLRDAKREAVPDLLLRAGEQYNGETVAVGPTRPVGAQSFAEAAVNLPLWNRNQGNIDAGKAEVERARQEVARAQLQLRQQVEPLAQSYESARFQADRYKNEIIPRARRAYELYLTKYQQMAEAYPQVIVSQRTLFQVQIGYLQSLLAVWSAATALQNNALHGGLEMPVASGTNDTMLNLPNRGGDE